LKINFLFPEEGDSVILQNIGTGSGLCGTKTQEVFYIENNTFSLGQYKFLVFEKKLSNLSRNYA
jgi:hypothetical protein